MTEKREDKFQAAIFDRDGVLTDFDVVGVTRFFERLVPIRTIELTELWVAYGKRVGFPHTLEEEQEFFDGFWADLSEDLGLSDSVRAELCGLDYVEFVAPYADALPALLYVRSRGLKIGVLSNFSLASLQRSLDAAELGSLVDVAISSSISHVAKPDPRAYLGIADALGVQPEKCLFFDNEVDCVDGAAAVGMEAFLVDRHGHYGKGDLQVLADLSDLETLLA